MKTRVSKTRPKITHWVSYKTKPYGEKSPMIQTKTEPATSLEDAKEWQKVYQKDKKNWDVQIEKNKPHLYRIWVGDENDRAEHARIKAPNLDAAVDWAKNRLIKKSAHKNIQEEGDEQNLYLMMYGKREGDSWWVQIEEDDSTEQEFKTLPYGTNEYYDLTK
jgi:hypothetical protein